MPPFFPDDFVSPSTAVALVGSSLYGEQWNGCHARREADRFYAATAALRKARTIARRRELWPALSASSRIMRRRARVLELSDEGAAKQFVSLDDADIKAIEDEIEAKFAEDFARQRRCWQARYRLLELLCSAQVTTTLLESSGNKSEMPCEFWASDQAENAVDSGKASYNPAIYKSGPFGMLQGRVLVPKADLIAALEGSPKAGDTGSIAAETRCEMWIKLKAEAWEKSDDPAPRRDDLCLEAQQKFTGLSKRSFYKAWAAEANPAWMLSGPKSSRRNS